MELKVNIYKWGLLKSQIGCGATGFSDQDPLN